MIRASWTRRDGAVMWLIMAKRPRNRQDHYLQGGGRQIHCNAQQALEKHQARGAVGDHDCNLCRAGDNLDQLLPKLSEIRKVRHPGRPSRAWWSVKTLRSQKLRSQKIVWL